MVENWKRYLLYFAGVWNIVGGAGALADPAGHLAQMYVGTVMLSDPVTMFFFRGVWINVIAWGIGYLIAARNFSGGLAVLAAGGLGKLAYCLACVAMWESGSGRPVLVVTGTMDAIFAGFFAYLLWSKR